MNPVTVSVIPQSPIVRRGGCGMLFGLRYDTRFMLYDFVRCSSVAFLLPSTPSCTLTLLSCSSYNLSPMSCTSAKQDPSYIRLHLTMLSLASDAVCSCPTRRAYAPPRRVCHVSSQLLRSLFSTSRLSLYVSPLSRSFSTRDAISLRRSQENAVLL